MINLLPEKNKKKVKNEMLRRLMVVFFSGISVLLLLQLVFSFVLFFLVNSYKQDYAQQVAVSENLAHAGNLQDMETEISRLNRMAVSFQNNREVAKPFSVYFLALLDSLTGEITIDTLTFDNLRLFLSGHAVTRDGLIAFIRHLESNEKFVSVDSPISNLLAGRDINFSLTININDN